MAGRSAPCLVECYHSGCFRPLHQREECISLDRRVRDTGGCYARDCSVVLLQKIYARCQIVNGNSANTRQLAFLSRINVSTWVDAPQTERCYNRCCFQIFFIPLSGKNPREQGERYRFSAISPSSPLFKRGPIEANTNRYTFVWGKAVSKHKVKLQDKVHALFADMETAED